MELLVQLEWLKDAADKVIKLFCYKLKQNLSITLNRMPVVIKNICYINAKTPAIHTKLYPERNDRNSS